MEAAENLGIPPGTIKSRTFRALLIARVHGSLRRIVNPGRGAPVVIATSPT
jgi:hypothetical protein